MTRSLARLVLIGGGHANLLLLAEFARRPWPCASVTLISECETHGYSGMVPGLLSGRYQPGDVAIDLAVFAERAGATFRRAAVVRIDALRREVILETDEVVSYDVAAIAVGSEVAGRERSGVHDLAAFVKPLGAALQLGARFDRALADGTTPLAVAVVGGGMAGIEVAIALRSRAERSSAIPPVIRLLHAGPGPIGPGAPAAAHHITAALARSAILRVGAADVVSVGAKAVTLRDGRTVPADLVVWTTGPVAPSVFRRSGLPTDAAGYLRVHATLRVPDVAGLFAAGDSAALPQQPPVPKAGVYAVRMGPILAHNVRAACGGAPEAGLRRYRPQTRFLAILMTGTDRAVAIWGPFAWTGRLAARWKDRIDRRFMARLQGAYRRIVHPDRVGGDGMSEDQQNVSPDS